MNDKFRAVLEDVRDHEIFQESGIIPTKLTMTNSNVLLVYGDNATGKSFLAKALSSFAISHMEDQSVKLECIHLSMNKRTGGDFTSAITRSMMFGSEDERSTGQISAHIIKMAFKTAASRDSSNMIIIDEPDIGLSESYHAAIGEYISDRISEISNYTIGVVIVTHSRGIAEEIFFRCNPCIANVAQSSDDFQPIEDWFANGPRKHSVAEFESLNDRAGERFRQISSYMRDLKARKKSTRRDEEYKP